MPKLKKKTESQKLAKDRLRKRSSQQRKADCDDSKGDEITSHTRQPHSGGANEYHLCGVHEESFYGISPDDVMSGELEIQILDYASQILKTQFNVIYGLHLPSYLYGLEKSHGPCTKIPNRASAVQIHIIPGHYLISALKDGQLYVYDSLYNRSHVWGLLPQLHLLYEDSVVDNLQYSCPQSQGFSTLCGFYALANAINFLLNIPLGGMSLDASRMRIHLRECFVNGHFATFPRAVTPDGFVSVGSERPISSSNPCETVISNRCEDRERKKPEVNTRVCKKRQSSTGVCPVSKTHDETSEFEIALQREFDSFQSVKKNKYLKNSGKTNSGNTYTILNQLSSGEVGITPNEEETIRSRNRIRQQQRRDRLDESQKDLQREMDRKRYRDKQSTMTLNDKRRRTEQNTVKQQLRRHTMTDKEKTLCLEKDRIQHSSARQEMTAEEKTRQREADKLQHRNTREEMPEEEKTRHREANKLQLRKTREEMPEEEKSRHREANKLQHRNTREEMPEEEKSRHHEADKLQHRKTREEMPEEEKSRHREANKLQHRKLEKKCPKKKNPDIVKQTNYNTAKQEKKCPKKKNPDIVKQTNYSTTTQDKK